MAGVLEAFVTSGPKGYALPFRFSRILGAPWPVQAFLWSFCDSKARVLISWSFFTEWKAACKG